MPLLRRPCRSLHPAGASPGLAHCAPVAVLLLLGWLTATGPSAAQTPVQRAVEAVTGEGQQSGETADRESQGAAPEEEGGASAGEGAREAAGEGAADEPAADGGGLFPEDPPDPILLREELLEAETWRRLAEEMLSALVRWLPSLLAAALILVVFFFLYRLASGVLDRLMARTRADPAVRGIANRLTKYTLLVLALMMAASQLGIQVGSLLAGVGIIGLALGLAAQDSLANLVAGLTILWDRPFRIGDNVTIAGTFGEVQEIGLRTTRIRTVEQLDTILPNKEIINATITNHTMNPMMRLGIPIGIAYKEDTREARRVLLDAVTGHDLILESPKPAVVVKGLGDSSVDLELRVWLRDPHTERAATFAMVEIAKIALDEAGIEIPFPQRTLHFPDPVGLRRLDGSE